MLLVKLNGGSSEELPHVYNAGGLTLITLASCALIGAGTDSSDDAVAAASAEAV